MKKEFTKERAERLLAECAIGCKSLCKDESETVLMRFIERFIDDGERESIGLRLRRSRTKQKPIEYHKYFPPSCARDVTNAVNRGEMELANWLSRGSENSISYLLWREPWMPVFQIDSSTFNNRKLSFFPGIYCLNFETGRVFAITLDADKIVCEKEGVD